MSAITGTISHTAAAPRPVAAEISLFRLYTLRVAYLIIAVGLGVFVWPLLLFEVAWKAIYLIAFAYPMWSAHQITPAMAEDVKAVSMVVILLPLIPWRYVFTHYVGKRGDRWK